MDDLKHFMIGKCIKKDFKIKNYLYVITADATGNKIILMNQEEMHHLI
jgi:hypothetical protein